MLVLFDGWTSFFRDKVVPWRIGMAEKLRAQLEEHVLPPFLEAQRWYAQKGEAIGRATLREYAVWDVGGRISWLLMLVEAKDTTYFMPLGMAYEEDEEQVKALSVASVARVRQQANVGVIGDAVADPAFCRHVVRAIGAGHTLPAMHGTLRFIPTSSFAAIAGDEVASLGMGRLHAQSTNTSVTLGERLFLKCYRRLRAGLHPELEVGRFLTETAGFANCVPLAGAVEYFPKEGEPMTVALLQAYVPNQGDGWAYTLAYLERFLESRRSIAEAPSADVHGAYLALVQTLAVRTAELHRAFAAHSGDAAFAPEPFATADLDEWKRRVRAEAEESFQLLERRLGELPEAVRPAAAQARAERETLLARIDGCAPPSSPTLKTRHHGDYHLGQVLLANNDFLIIDFEGEPTRPLAEIRHKRSPLRDVAGMLRSFSYARWAALMPTGTDAGLERLASLGASWEEAARAAFLASYAEAAKGSGLFASFGDVQGLLALAEIEKVLYELRYELLNRPAWLQIPLHGLAAAAKPRGG